MLHASAPVGTKPIETQTISFFVYLREQPGPKRRPLGGIDLAFEYRILNPLSKVLTESGDPTKSSPTGRIASCHIVGDEHQHGRSYLQTKGG